jgi:hypothetical protein
MDISMSLFIAAPDRKEVVVTWATAYYFRVRYTL